MADRHITLWRTGNPIVWDFYVSESEREAGNVMQNLTSQGIKVATTYKLGEKVEQLSVGAA